MLVFAAHKLGDGDIEAGAKMLLKRLGWGEGVVGETYTEGIIFTYKREGVKPMDVWKEDASHVFMCRREDFGYFVDAVLDPNASATMVG